MNPPNSATKKEVPTKLVIVVADLVRLKFMYPEKYVIRLAAIQANAMFSSPSIAAQIHQN
jgi:hypothetical protein